MENKTPNLSSAGVTALVPMRHHSQRVPGKNYRLLDGKPLYQHIIATLQQVPEVEQIVVDTDSPEIIAGLKADFPAVIVLDRPAHLRADDISMNEILLYDISRVPAALYLQTHSTNPLLSAETLSRAIRTLLKAMPGNDSLFSVTRHQARFYAHDGKPINHNPRELLQTQDLNPVYEENSCIYIFPPETLQQNRTRIGQRPILFETDPEESLDIDEESDFRLVELALAARKANG